MCQGIQQGRAIDRGLCGRRGRAGLAKSVGSFDKPWVVSAAKEPLVYSRLSQTLLQIRSLPLLSPSLEGIGQTRASRSRLNRRLPSKYAARSFFGAEIGIESRLRREARLYPASKSRRWL